MLTKLRITIKIEYSGSDKAGNAQAVMVYVRSPVCIRTLPVLSEWW